MGRLEEAQARGDVIIIRFADDFIVGFEHREDAERFREELGGRLAKFGLELHPGKTRLIEFGRLAARLPHGTGRGETGDVHVPGVHAHLRDDQAGTVLGQAEHRHEKVTAKLSRVKAEMRRRRTCPSPSRDDGWPPW